MEIPLTFLDATLWLTGTALVLLFTSELVSEYGFANIYINKGRLKKIALAAALLFVVIALVRTYLIVIAFRPT